ncbi:MAG: ribonuclease HI family protein [Rhodocyclales bacterium]|nr:ribonuclease HI family protein [Rhodocyclales bacterium]
MTASSSPACFDACRQSGIPGAQGAGIDADDCWQAWFDGSALPNPGKIGVGVILLSPAGVRSDNSVLPGCSGCNNEAELHALRVALEMACQAGARRLVLRGDSDVAIRYVRGPDSTQISRLVVRVAEARDWLQRFEDVQLVWIPRHRNTGADRLSRQALGLPEVPDHVARRRRRPR